MRIKVIRQPSFWCPASLGCVALLFLACSGAGQSITLTIQNSKNQVAIFWPAGLGLVQPQRATNLLSGAWQNFGLATASTNLTDTTGVERAFYRLRFIAPSIVTQPQGQTLAVGSNAIFNVAATGTFPLAYQWRRNGTNLTGKTATLLALTNVIVGDAGDYSVVIANQAGAATSVVAVLSLAVPFSSPRGIYMGKFAGQTNSGGVAIMARTNGLAIVLGSSAPEGGSLFATNLLVSASGSFSTLIDNGGKLNGAFSAAGVNGTFASTNGFTAAFSAPPKLDTGIHQSDAGFYSGSFGGLLSGKAYLILASDGTVFTYLAATTLGESGAFGVIDPAKTLVATTSFTLPGTTTPGILGIKGLLNSTTHQFTGTYSFSGFELGTFSLSRVSSP